MVDKDEHDHQINYPIEVPVYLRIENNKSACLFHILNICLIAHVGSGYYFIIRKLTYYT